MKVILPHKTAALIVISKPPLAACILFWRMMISPPHNGFFINRQTALTSSFMRSDTSLCSDEEKPMLQP